KEFKTGAVRMAKEAQVPIVPVIVWGAQRLWTKDHPKALGRRKFPITVAVGRPIVPDRGTAEMDGVLRVEMTQLLHDVQVEYGQPEGAFWLPHRLGGGAPTPAEAMAMEEVELAERARRRATRRDRGRADDR
ncbi:1-acyl-sn-glycerol-3-phosphate acyltransferase, partial [Mycobacterium sp. ITM-2017-0098]